MKESFTNSVGVVNYQEYLSSLTSAIHYLSEDVELGLTRDLNTVLYTYLSRQSSDLPLGVVTRLLKDTLSIEVHLDCTPVLSKGGGTVVLQDLPTTILLFTIHPSKSIVELRDQTILGEKLRAMKILLEDFISKHLITLATRTQAIADLNRKIQDKEELRRDPYFPKLGERYIDYRIKSYQAEIDDLTNGTDEIRRQVNFRNVEKAHLEEVIQICDGGDRLSELSQLLMIHVIEQFLLSTRSSYSVHKDYRR